MAHSLSAKKRIRQNEKRRLLNRARNSAVKTQIKKFFTAAKQTSDMDQVETELKLAQKRIHQLAVRGVIHSKTASRKISRLSRTFNTFKTKSK